MTMKARSVREDRAREARVVSAPDHRRVLVTGGASGLGAALVAAFGYGPEHLRAAIATGAEQTRQEEARAWYEAARADGTLPRPEKAPRH